MTILTINGMTPDSNGNINIPHGPQGDQGIQGIQGIQGPRGPQGYSYPLYANQPMKNLKFWTTIAVVGAEGSWSVNYTEANFSEVFYVSCTMIQDNQSQANAPLASHISSWNNTICTGKAFKATSAGLLAAMQQVYAVEGTRLMVMVVGA